jgi:ADP-ribosylglycohydrolase
VDRRDRIEGAVWGHLVGDAVGVPYEFKSPRSITEVRFGAKGTYGQPPGTWSDDGALMLALLDSLTRDRSGDEAAFDTADQARRFLAWADGTAYTPDDDGRFDIGIATSAAMSRLRAGVAPEEAGGRGERDNGNGSLMRILPLALLSDGIGDAEMLDRAHRCSAITHGHPISQAACALYVLIARQLLEGASPAGALDAATDVLRRAYATRDDREAREAALETLLGWSGRSGDGFVVDALWSAWDAVALTASYQEAIEVTVRYGNDTDTTAAIAGGLAGIRFGQQGIPGEWLAGMRGKAIVEPLLARLEA